MFIFIDRCIKKNTCFYFIKKLLIFGNAESELQKLYTTRKQQIFVTTSKEVSTYLIESNH